MIDDSEFTGKVGVHLHYADTLATPECLRILELHLTDGTWAEAAEEWFNIAYHVARRADSPVKHVDLLLRWFAVVETGPIHTAAQTWLPQVVSWARRDGILDSDLRRIVRWFVDEATPGAAGAGAQLLTFNPGSPAVEGGPKVLEAVFVPLVIWLLQNGAAALRTSQSGPLVVKMCEALHVHGRSELVELALRYLVVGGHVVHGWTPDRQDGLWPVVEVALERGAAPSLAADTCILLVDRREPSREMVWRPLIAWERFPLCRLALISALASGVLDSKHARDAWPLIVVTPCPTLPPRFRRPADLTDAHETLQHRVAFEREEFLRSEHALVWVAHLVREQVRVHELNRPGRSNAAAWRELQHLAAWDDRVNEVMIAILKEALEAAADDARFGLALKLLGQSGKASRRLTAAIADLSTRRSTRRADEQVDLTFLQEEFTRIVNLLWDRPVFGIPMGALIGSAREVRFEALTNDNKVLVEPDSIRLDPGYYRETLAGMGHTEESRALCTIYFLHEFIHLWQGIGEMKAVQALRSTGAEMTLMHLDLAADHAAALLAVEAVPKWDLLWLKDLQGRSLSAFPASSFHTQAARHRKAVRLVSIRLDYLARKTHLVPMEKVGSGYVFADYGPAGGHILVMALGPPPMMLRSSTISEPAVKVLVGAADEPGDPVAALAALDEVLVAALRGD
jgi:hypothetical protein